MVRSQKHVPDPAERFAEGNLFRLLQALVGMLTVARLLYPPEGSVLGDTLWITQGWILAVLIWGWDAHRRNDYRLKLSLMDGAVWLVVAGHGLSTLWVLFGNGNGRSALNLMWEWVGLGFSFFLLRQVLRTKRDGPRFLAMLISAAVLLAGYGIWQHYVELPRLAEDYERITEELGEQSKIGTFAARQETARLERELADMGVPQSSISRSLWENRLRSTEPFATFALANTLAGFLVAWLFAGAGFLTFQARISNFWSRVTWRDAGKLVCLLLIGFCLILTKSRTAWVGFIAGLGAWFAVAKAAGFRMSRRWLFAGLGVFLAAGVFFAIAAQSGGFDRKVISEAPKSLAYRLQYWSGAWEVVKEHPWLGTGPGNFRQHYLRYKLPESSEEIADPHNWIFDLWTSGGLLALAGFFLLLGLAVCCLRRERSIDNSDDKSISLSAWEIGAAIAFPVVMLVRWLAGEFVEFRPVWLLLAGGVVWGILRKNTLSRNDESITAAFPVPSPDPLPQGERGHKTVIDSSFPRVPIAGLFAGGVALMVHLLGAGGIEMPAITQTVLVLLVFLDWEAWVPNTESLPTIPRAPLRVSLMSGLGLIGFGLCLVSATVPVWYRNLYVLIGNAALASDHKPLAAARAFEQAEAADPYSPEPAESLSELYFQLWLGSQRERDFERAVRFGKLAVRRDPAAYGEYRRLGAMYSRRAGMDKSAEDAGRAVTYLSEAVKRYPNYAPLRAERAMAYQLAGEAKSARREAKIALELDQINHAEGHRDKFLPRDVLGRLEDLKRKTP